MSYKDLQKTRIKANTKDEVDLTDEFRTYLLGLFDDEYVSEAHERLYAVNAGFCARKNTFEAFYSAKENSDALRKFRQNFGHSAEATFVETLMQSGKLIANDIKITDIRDHINEEDYGFHFLEDDFLNYSGKIDFIFYNHDGKIILADSKNTSSLPDKPSLNYVRQLQFYAAITGIDDAVLLYTTRQCGFINQLEFNHFFVDTSQKALEQVLFTAFLSRYAIDSKLIVSIPDGFKKTTTCKYCKFNSFCWGEDKDAIFYPLDNALVETEMLLEYKARESAKKLYASRNKRKELFLNFLLKND